MGVDLPQGGKRGRGILRRERGNLSKKEHRRFPEAEPVRR